MSYPPLTAPDMAFWHRSGLWPEGFGALPTQVHRTIIYVDVEGFADPFRTNSDQTAVRRGLYRALDEAFAASRVPWREHYYEDRGDGALILIPPEVPKNILATRIPGDLAAALTEHNHTHRRPARIRLRMAIHAGEILPDEHGVAGDAINLTSRLLEAKAFKRALRRSSGVLALIASQWFFDEVIRHHPAGVPDSYRRVRVSVKKTRAVGWIRLPEAPSPWQPALAMANADDRHTRATPAVAYVSDTFAGGGRTRRRGGRRGDPYVPKPRRGYPQFS